MGRVSQPTPPVKSISQVGLRIMLVPLFFLTFFASCFHVETSTDLGMGENMNVNMNDVDMAIGGGTRNAFDWSGDDDMWQLQDILQSLRGRVEGRITRKSNKRRRG